MPAKGPNPPSATPSQASPTPQARTRKTYRIRELAELARVSPRTIRYYLELGLLPSTRARGPATVYGREHLVRLQAIHLLRTRDRMPLLSIRRRLATLALPQIEALVAPPTAEQPATTAAPPLGRRWDRIELVSGLELHLRTDAPPLLQRLAKEIIERYGNQASSDASPTTPPSPT